MNERDERRHAATDARDWNEWWYLDFATEDGFGGFVRLALVPNRNVAWYWAYVVVPDAPGPIVVRDHEVPFPRRDWLELRADGLWAECTCETPFEHWTYGLEAFGVRLEQPGDAYRGEIGERLAVGFDLEWELATPVFARDGETRYAQAGTVNGELLLGRERIEIDANGTRAHGWGPQYPWAVGSWWAGFQHDGSFALVVDQAGGYVWRDGAAGESITDVAVETHTGPDNLPVAGRLIVDHHTEIDIDVVALAPVPIDEAGVRLPRALCRFTVDGGAHAGNGWAEWCQPRPK